MPYHWHEEPTEKAPARSQDPSLQIYDEHNVEMLVRKENYQKIAEILSKDCLLQIWGDYSPVGLLTKKKHSESVAKHTERNANLAYRALAQYCRETRAPPAVREFYSRHQRDLEETFPTVCSVEAFGEG